MKITEKNRSLVFLGGTMLMGILIIGVLLLFEIDGPSGPEMPTIEKTNTFKPLESKIKNLKTQNFDPNSYNTIATEINSSYDQELLTSDQKTNLMSSLSTVYSDLVYARCEFYLNGMGLDSGKNVTSWLNQLEKITARNAKIVNYRNQIKWYDYYSTTLSAKVYNFINPGITNYNDDRYKMLTDEVSKMPNLDPTYKNKTKFIQIRNKLLLALQNFNAEFYSI